MANRHALLIGIPVYDDDNSARTLSEVTKAVTADMERRSRAGWLRGRLEIYAPLFSLELDPPGEAVVD